VTGLPTHSLGGFKIQCEDTGSAENASCGTTYFARVLQSDHTKLCKISGRRLPPMITLREKKHFQKGSLFEIRLQPHTLVDRNDSGYNGGTTMALSSTVASLLILRSLRPMEYFSSKDRCPRLMNMLRNSYPYLTAILDASQPSGESRACG
jgi:hypothetical protein